MNPVSRDLAPKDAGILFANLLGCMAALAPRDETKMSDPTQEAPAKCGAELITLFLCGDVMTGRGIDQLLPHPSTPHLYESYMRSAVEYVELAEQRTGALPRKVDFAYIWGDALAELRLVRPEARIINLETAVTLSEDAWPGKGIHYRMHPQNLPCLTAANLDCCVLANNHLMDWGRKGLAETLATLHKAGLRTAGAGCDQTEATAPAQIELPGGTRVLVFAFATHSAGVPLSWAAGKERSGVNLLADLAPRRADTVARLVARHKRRGDLVVLSIHWGDNWGYEIPTEQRRFARRVIDSAGVDIVHGHSSHHPKGIEVYKDRLILFGCGDFLNDYEGISGHDAYRPDLALMYFPTVDPATGRLQRFTMTPTRIHHFRVNRAPKEAALWLKDTLNREGKMLGTQVELTEDGRLLLTSSQATIPVDGRLRRKGVHMIWPTLAALFIDININPPAKEGAYRIELRWRPEPPGGHPRVRYAADANDAVREAEKALQENFILDIPIEFRGQTYETIAEAVEAIRTRINQ